MGLCIAIEMVPLDIQHLRAVHSSLSGLSMAALAHLDSFGQPLDKLSRQGHTEVLGQCSQSGCAAPPDGHIGVVQAA